MKQRSGMPYDVVAYETDELALQLSEIEEGLFHRMLRKAWVNGSIPADLVALAPLCRTHLSRLKKAWVRLAPLWTPHPTEAGRLINLKQERERAWVEEKSDKSTQAIEKRWKEKKTKDGDHTDVLPTNNKGNTPLPVPSHPNPTIENGEVKPTGEAADAAADLFAKQHLERTKAGYVWAKGDFVQLAALRKANGIAARASPDGWDVAVRNYFASPLSKYTLADCANRYPVLRNSALDRYGKPVTEIGGNDGTLFRNPDEPPGSTSKRRTSRGDPIFIPRQ